MPPPQILSTRVKSKRWDIYYYSSHDQRRGLLSVVVCTFDAKQPKISGVPCSKTDMQVCPNSTAINVHPPSLSAAVTQQRVQRATVRWENCNTLPSTESLETQDLPPSIYSARPFPARKSSASTPRVDGRHLFPSLKCDGSNILGADCLYIDFERALAADYPSYAQSVC